MHGLIVNVQPKTGNSKREVNHGTVQVFWIYFAAGDSRWPQTAPDSGSRTKRRKAMKAAQFTLTSTVLAAALALGLGLAAAPAMADPPPHNHGGGGGTTFTVQLFDESGGSTGAFDFCPWGDLCGAIEVTPNTRENELRSNTDLDMVRPTASDLEATWNAVFNACEEILGTDSVFKFFVANDDWRIAKAGGVRVIFRDIELLRNTDLPELQGAEVRVQLIGDQFVFDNPDMANEHPFLPAPEQMSVFQLVDFLITGTPVKGMGAIKSCRGSEGGGLLMVPSTLVIRAE